jgi:predicted RNA binding protein YcfA (HicA-like mRNA interferase family)
MFSICSTFLYRTGIEKPFYLGTCDRVYSCVYFAMMSSSDIIRLLRSDGWQVVRQKGSHVQLRHPTKPGRVTVPHPNKDVPMGTLKSIEKQSGLTLRR